MNRTPDDQRSDNPHPGSDDQQGMPGKRSGQSKPPGEDKGSQQQGESGGSQISVPPDMPKE